MTAVGLLGFAVLVSSSSQRLFSAESNPKTMLQEARNDVRGRHLAEAAAAYEKIAGDSSKDAAKYKADALYELLLLRVSGDPAVHDLQRAAVLAQALRAYGSYPRSQEISAFDALLKEVDRRVAEEKQAGDKRLADTSAALTARAADLQAQLTAARQADETGKLKVETASLRSENKTLRDEAKTLRDQLVKAQAEIQKRDDALKRVAGSLIKPR
jgi:hypothetical protein